MRDLMIDIKTLGTAPGSVILSIGAVAFDAETGAFGNEFYEAIEARSAVAAGLTIDAGTIGWWMVQSQEARQAAFAGDLPLIAALYTFNCFVQREKATRIWAKPPSFDLVLLEYAFRACNMPTPWHFRETRDVRTLLDIAGTRQPYLGTAHNALDDAKSQALGVIEAFRALARPPVEANTLRPVIIESPFKGKVEENTAYARAAMRDCLMRGEAPYASHLLYTQPGVLDDNNPEQRALGIEAGLAWGKRAVATVVYTDNGISEGMQLGIDRAKAEGRAVEYRSLVGDAQAVGDHHG